MSLCFRTLSYVGILLALPCILRYICVGFLVSNFTTHLYNISLGLGSGQTPGVLM